MARPSLPKLIIRNPYENGRVFPHCLDLVSSYVSPRAVGTGVADHAVAFDDVMDKRKPNKFLRPQYVANFYRSMGYKVDCPPERHRVGKFNYWIRWNHWSARKSGKIKDVKYYEAKYAKTVY